MSALTDYRAAHPEYNAIGDSDLADALYSHAYSDKMARPQFDAAIGLHQSGQLAGSVNPMAVVKPGAAADSLGNPIATSDLGKVAPVPYDQGAVAAYASNVFGGVPVLGATEGWIKDLADHLASGITGKPYDEVKAHADMVAHDTAEAHPIAAGAGNLTGGIAGYGLAATAAPAFFGAGAAALPLRAGISGLTNAGIAGGDTAARGGSANDILKSAGAGGALGFAAPIGGAAIGAIARPIARRFSNWFGGVPAVPGMRTSAANALGDSMVRDAATKDIPGRLAELGQGAVLPDASQAARGWAQGLNDKFPQIENTLVARDKGWAPQVLPSGQVDPGHVLRDLETNYGPAGNSPLKETSLIAAEAKLEGQALPPIFQAAPKVNTSAVLATIGMKLKTASGPEAKALSIARDELMGVNPKTGQPMPHDNAEKLNNVKKTLSGLIEHGNPGLGIPAGSVRSAQGTLKLVTGQLNQALRDQVPGYGDVMDKIAALMRQREQLKAGTEIMRSGEAGVHPQDLGPEMAGLRANAPEEAAAKVFGARAAVDRTIRQNPNDRSALKQVLGDPGDFKRQNAEILFGEQPTANMARTGDRAATFADTKHRVVDNSETARRQAAEKMANPDISSGIGVTAGVAALHPAALLPYAGLRAIQKSTEGIRGVLLKGRNSDIAKAVVAGNAPTLSAALIKRGIVRTTAGQSSARVASDLARALIGYEGAVRKGQELPSPSTIAKGALGTGMALYNMVP